MRIRAWAIERVETAVGGQLGDGGIVPVTVAADNSHLDPRVAVGGSLSDSDRDNKLLDEAATVRIIVDGTQTFVEREGTLALTEIQWSIHEELTKQDDRWGQPSLDQMDEVQYDDQLDRFLGVMEYSVERIRPHPAQS